MVFFFKATFFVFLKTTYKIYEKEWKTAVSTIADSAAKHGIKFVQAHSPNAKILDEARSERERFLTRRSIEICDMLGIENVVVHTGYDPANDKDAYFEKNRDYYRQFFPLMEKTGVNILVENTLRYHISKGGYYLLKGTDYVEFLEYVNHPLLNAVWDTGHGTAEGCQYENVTAIGKYLKGLHVHDNNGDRDTHTLPYYGKVDWESVMKALADIGYAGDFNYEASAFIKDIPVALYEDGLAYMAKVGHYLIGRFEYYKNNK